ncbi:MAG TPA: N-acetylmuramoyl-L-alanine amidase [Clostridia bacterium]|nr:N-acetylmuramoyl-L-alanine amidase [Clostridia bacterium]
MIWLKTLRIRRRYLVFILALGVLGFGLFRYTSGHLVEREIAAISWSVAGKIIVVDAGHGGKDSGARGPGGVLEKDITLPVALKLAEVLKQAGANVILTRETDVFECDPKYASWPSQQRANLDMRASLANDNNADVFLSIHVNSFPGDPGQKGGQVFAQPGNEESMELAKAVQFELVRMMGNTKREAKQEDYYITRTAKMPAVLIEVGFISNPNETKLMMDPAYQNKLAWAIYAGVVKYFSESGLAGDATEEVWKPLQEKAERGVEVLHP